MPHTNTSFRDNSTCHFTPKSFKKNTRIMKIPMFLLGATGNPLALGCHNSGMSRPSCRLKVWCLKTQRKTWLPEHPESWPGRCFGISLLTKISESEWQKILESEKDNLENFEPVFGCLGCASMSIVEKAGWKPWCWADPTIFGCSRCMCSCVRKNCAGHPGLDGTSKPSSFRVMLLSS